MTGQYLEDNSDAENSQSDFERVEAALEISDKQNEILRAKISSLEIEFCHTRAALEVWRLKKQLAVQNEKIDHQKIRSLIEAARVGGINA